MYSKAQYSGMKSSFGFLIFSLLFIHLRHVNSSYINDEPGKEESSSDTSDENGKLPPKLIVIMFDGFRWDYYNNHKTKMVAFEQFLSEGVQAEWVEPIFPSLSYPAWTTISTGLFPESHGILGNYMYDKKERVKFDLNDLQSTTRREWWQTAEPIWTTATKAGKDVFLRFWSRCDVDFQGIIPKECIGYVERRGNKTISDTLQIAAHKIETHDLVMVYNEHIDNVGHQYGPESTKITEALEDVNAAFSGFLDTLLDNEIYDYDKINIIVISDHGMVDVGPDSNTTYVELGKYVDEEDVNIVIDRGAVASIDTYLSKREKVYQNLKSNMPGVDVYKRDEIPENYHYKNSHLAHELLVVAKPKHFILGIQPRDKDKQLPLDSPIFRYRGGIHGYPPNMKEMNGIFFAKGPAFKKKYIHPPIHMEDIYQIFANILDIEPQPHNGSWDRVSGMFINASSRLICLSCLHILSLISLLILFY